MPSIARKNLFEDLPRFLVAQAGIMFAVSLVTIQTGIFQGVIRSTALMVERSKADIWLGSENLANVEMTLQIPFERLEEAQTVEGVSRAEALIVNGTLWRDRSGNLNHVRIVGFDPQGELFSPGEIVKGRIDELNDPYAVFVDEASATDLNVAWVNDVVEVGAFRTRVVGFIEGLQNSINSPLVLTSLENANAYVTSRPGEGAPDLSPDDPEALGEDDKISFVLIEAATGEDLDVLKQRLQDALPNTIAYTREEMTVKTRTYWEERTGIGFILGLGAVVGIVVGMVVVGQILYSSVSDHLKEFGTLKAMGASDWTIYSVIIEQALWMAVLGYLPGMALCFGVRAWVMTAQGLTIAINPMTAVGVFGLTVVMCVGSAIFAIQKVNRVDPAIVFKA
ncbi:FtsX-like permease family protein [Oxynema sp. CENA135]|uniref:FtsX-like permease family protein n=1 Tax=Oxynema sp. CENA135 TaxID=984206 RepID=UPI00190B48C3|nr:FtsX-like permease family protein [Oxynema sp. CENA135]MBK4731411.1 FtsX-like permease family protein [Oxynema sp. CENA135]